MIDNWCQDIIWSNLQADVRRTSSFIFTEKRNNIDKYMKIYKYGEIIYKHTYIYIRYFSVFVDRKFQKVFYWVLQENNGVMRKLQIYVLKDM